mmetsp:Transcript_15096/g.45595  ORF Transcript_15096/g.45595 Transcript_15096/m.45595 type:complete len:94 (-) Transcript_15096:3463-3744(-)
MYVSPHQRMNHLCQAQSIAAGQSERSAEDECTRIQNASTVCSNGQLGLVCYSKGCTNSRERARNVNFADLRKREVKQKKLKINVGHDNELVTT